MTECGIFKELSCSDYEAIPAIRQSHLKLMGICPKAYKWSVDEMLADEPTAAMNFGTAVHWRVLQPERYLAQVAVKPDVDRRTKVGKAEYEEFLLANPGKVIITAEEAETCQAIARELETLTAAKKFLRPAEYELTLVWRDRETGIYCKARLDCYQEHTGVVTDLKTTVSALYHRFSKSIFDYGYHQQGAWYLSGLRRLGLPAKHFLLLACEKEPPYLNALYRLDDEVLEMARLQNEANLKKVAACQATGQWPGLDDYVQDITLPEWTKKQLGGI